MEAVHVLEAGLVCDGVDDEEAVPRAHVLLPHGAELLLPGCVQNCGGMGSQGCHQPPSSPLGLKTPTLLLSPQWLSPNCPVRATQGPWAVLGGFGGPQTPQCDALMDLFVDPLIPTHGAPWTLVLCLHKGLRESVINSASKSLWRVLRPGLRSLLQPFQTAGLSGSHPTLSLLSSSVLRKCRQQLPGSPNGDRLFVDVTGESPKEASRLGGSSAHVGSYLECPLRARATCLLG